MKNREIKFRAYSITQGMIYFTMEDLILNRKNFQHLIDYPQLPKMEYTGRKDNKGVEKYEGDILASGNGFIHVIEKKCYSEGWNFVFKQIGYKEEYDTGEDTEIIIGNIYQNPELLSITDNT